MEKTINKIEISPYSKIRVVWETKPEDYSKESLSKIKAHFSTKYNVPKESIHVVFKPIRIDKNGNKIEIENGLIDNVLDINYQRGLFKEWIKREEKDVDFDRIIKLDDKVNGELSIEFKENNLNRKWELKWLKINNFLSFGEDNFISFSKLKGLTIINSIPSNMGGKCVKYNTKIKVKFDENEIIKKIGFLPDELK